MEDANQSIYELVMRKWEHEWDARHTAHVERIAEEMGCTWRDIVMENRDLFLDPQKDAWNHQAGCIGAL